MFRHCPPNLRFILCIIILPVLSIPQSLLAQELQTDFIEAFDNWMVNAQNIARNQPGLIREQAIEYASILEKAGSERAFKAYYVAALSYSAVQDYQESRRNLVKSLQFLDKKKHPDNHAIVLIEIANDYADESNHAKAFEYYTLALGVAKENGLHECLEYSIMNQVSLSLFEVDDLNGAQRLLESIPLDNRCSAEQNSFTFSSLANVAFGLEDYDGALNYLNSFFSIVPQELVIYITRAKLSYALALIELQQLEEAEKIALDVQREIREKDLTLPTRQLEWVFANLTAAEKNSEEALEYALIALADDQFMSPERRVVKDHNMLPLVIDLLIELGQVKQASSMMMRLRKSNQKYFSATKASLLSIAEARLNLAAREGEIAFLNQEKQIGKLKFERLSFFAAFLAVVTILLILSAVRIYRNSRDKTELNLLLEDYAQDVYERAQSAELKLVETETLFNEAHHRLKNNLQFLINLLDMQRRRLGSTASNKMSGVLVDVINRVQAMALIHHHSVNDKREPNAPICQILQSLVDQSIDDGSIVIDIDCAQLVLDQEVSKSLVLIVNELLCNAQKHAFDEQGGKVDIILQAAGNSQNRLVVQDNGKGMPESSEPIKSMGMQLVKTMVNQINGSLKVVSNNSGTKWVVDF